MDDHKLYVVCADYRTLLRLANIGFDPSREGLQIPYRYISGVMFSLFSHVVCMVVCVCSINSSFDLFEKKRN